MVAFSIGPISVHRYGIFYFIWFLWGYFFLRFLWKKKVFSNYPNLQNILEHKLEDLLIAIILGVIIGWRLGHVLIYDFNYFIIQHPLEIFAIRKGWMSFIWGMIGSLISLLVLKKIQKLNSKEFRLLLDCIVAIVPLGILFGRIWNFLNQELYGIIIPENSRNLWENTINILKTIHIFHIYPQIGQEFRVNTNFLSSLFEGLINLIILMILTFKRIRTKIFRPGFLVWIFLIYYSIIRFILDYFRQGSQFEFISLFTKSQRFFIIFFIVGIYLTSRHLYQKKKN